MQPMDAAIATRRRPSVTNSPAMTAPAIAPAPVATCNNAKPEAPSWRRSVTITGSNAAWYTTKVTTNVTSSRKRICASLRANCRPTASWVRNGSWVTGRRVFARTNPHATTTAKKLAALR